MNTARELTDNLVALLRREHYALADFLIALADFDRRLHAMLAGSFQAQGAFGPALAHGLRALAHDPSRIGRLLGYPIRRLRRSASA